MTRGAVFTLPNSISMSRLVLALGFVLIAGTWERVAIIVVAGITDFMDGWLARHEKAESETGALIDPLADRIFAFVAITVYLVEGRFTPGQYLIFLSRDIATAVGFLVAKIIPWLRPAVFRARMLGKLVTVLQLVALVAVLVTPAYTTPLVIGIGILSAAAIVDYTVALWRGRAR
ncbi:MAG TPA: CDP-alcohol phosphatidyltransferase family protein [Gemmatimonadaceae bacterium]|nr:CDP-alcohol phosphatidyltransferase family protein [Gemmatimonadaceae bacterium]